MTVANFIRGTSDPHKGTEVALRSWKCDTLQHLKPGSAVDHKALPCHAPSLDMPSPWCKPNDRRSSCWQDQKVSAACCFLIALCVFIISQKPSLRSGSMRLSVRGPHSCWSVLRQQSSMGCGSGLSRCWNKPEEQWCRGPQLCAWTSLRSTLRFCLLPSAAVIYCSWPLATIHCLCSSLPDVETH